MNALSLHNINNYNNYYKFKNNLNEEQETPIKCESIFIYTTCEPEEKENISFKGKMPINTNAAKFAIIPALAAAATSIVNFFSKSKTKTNNYEEDVKRIIQNQKDMEYICALKSNFVPHSEFDEMVLGNYNKNLDMLENVNIALISKIVDDILSKKNFKNLPADYPERIKERAYCLSTWSGDCFTLGEKDVEYFISKLKEEDKEKTKQKEQVVTKEPVKYFTPKDCETVTLGKIEPGTILNAFGINQKTTTARTVIDLLKAETKEENENIKIIDEIYKDFECGNITSKEAFDRIIELLENMKISPNYNNNDSNVHEGIIDIIE